MRTIRLMIVALFAVNLAIVPISAAMAMSAMSHGAKTEMSMSSSMHDCPCCNAAKKCATDLCQFKCFGTPAISVRGLSLVEPLPETLIAGATAAWSPVTLRPDPPPPRS